MRGHRERGVRCVACDVQWSDRKTAEIAPSPLYDASLHRRLRLFQYLRNSDKRRSRCIVGRAFRRAIPQIVSPIKFSPSHGTCCNCPHQRCHNRGRHKSSYGTSQQLSDVVPFSLRGQDVPVRHIRVGADCNVFLERRGHTGACQESWSGHLAGQTEARLPS